MLGMESHKPPREIGCVVVLDLWLPARGPHVKPDLLDDRFRSVVCASLCDQLESDALESLPHIGMLLDKLEKLSLMPVELCELLLLEQLEEIGLMRLSEHSRGPRQA